MRDQNCSFKIKIGMLVQILTAIIITIVFLCNTLKVDAADYESAPTLALNSGWSEEYWLTDSSDEQWYKIIVPSDGKISYKIMAYTGLYSALYTEDLSKRLAQEPNGGNGTATSPVTRTTERVLSKGVYYLKVYPGFMQTGKYKINISFIDYKTNDSMAFSYDSPQNIPLNTVVTGAITETDLEDWYCFNVSSPSQYRLQISSCFSLYFTLYNSDLSKEIESTHGVSINGSETSPGTEFYDIELISGTYYLKINRSAYATGKYTVSYNLKKTDLSKANIIVVPKTYTYDGKTKKPSITVKVENRELRNNVDYSVSYKNNKNAGKAIVTIKAKEGSNYVGSKSSIFTIKKASQVLKTNVIKKNYKVKKLKVKSEKFTIKVSKNKTLITYKVAKGSSKYITVSKKGVVTMKRGTKRGTYRVTVTAKETKNYNKAKKSITIIVK